MKEPLKAAQLSRRGVSDSPESWGEKPRTLKPNGAPRFIRLESNFALTDCGVRSFLEEVEELPAVRRWDVLPAHSESRRGRNMKRTFSPSLPPSDRDPLQILVRFQFHASSEQVSCQSCLSFTLFPSQTPKTWSLSMLCVCVCGFSVTEATFKISLFICLFSRLLKVYWGEIAGKKAEKHQRETDREG